MNYIKVSIECNQQTSEIMIAILADIGYEGFEEHIGLLNAYVKEEEFDKNKLETILENSNLTAETTIVEKTNWNKQWEENFSPVIVDDFCAIRADFHELIANTRYEIIITPKMSFGTGHHSTTQLMIEGMREMDFKGKVVLDFGTGTGVLAILASMMHAASVLGIDNESWACENAFENSSRNNITNLEIISGSLEAIPGIEFDIILANINRHILLHYMTDMYDKLKLGGHILMSGILKEDETMIVSSAREAGFKFISGNTKNNWSALKFEK